MILSSTNQSLVMTRTFTAIVYWEDDVYVAECPEVGTASQSETIEEAISHLKEATELYLEEFPLSDNSSIKPSIAYAATSSKNYGS
jgi:predicted RNase H-like HicB family nuclease